MPSLTARYENQNIYKMKIKTMAAMLAMAFLTATAAQAQGGKEDGSIMTKKWSSVAPKLTDDFFTTAEAARIGDNLLFYQHPTGGWPKNLQLQDELTPALKRI